MKPAPAIPVPPCPWCHTAKKIYVVPQGFQCLNCGRLFDDNPDEGGTHMDDPTKRAEREETRRRIDRLALAAAAVYAGRKKGTRMGG
jgi:hypothetical protein